ncbi:hypothetical protein ACFRKD_20960 [Streptomyces niveus]|uniref:hypothetical protein n=1 Tax=Streptomyces niveus TaxID=193462 RepID=UPI0036CDD150
MDTAGDQKQASSSGAAVRDVVRAVIAEVAAEELPVVDGLRRFDDETVIARLTSRRRGREPLGFGLEEMVYLATPVIWVALDESVRRVVGRTIDGTPSRSGGRFGGMFRRRSAPLVVPVLNADQVAEVRRRIMELSAQTGLEAERAETLADRVAVHLLLPADSPAPSRRTNRDDDTDELNTPA